MYCAIPNQVHRPAHFWTVLHPVRPAAVPVSSLLPVLALVLAPAVARRAAAAAAELRRRHAADGAAAAAAAAAAAGGGGVAHVQSRIREIASGKKKKQWAGVIHFFWAKYKINCGQIK